MTNAPERIWIEDEFGDGDDDQWAYGTWDVRNYAGYDVEYVRADIVQALTADFARQVQRTDEQREAYEQALSVMEADNERLQSLLAESASDLTSYVNAEYPPDTCAQYPNIARRRERDMDLVRRIEAELKGESHD